MIVWGGHRLNSNTYLSDGARYDPQQDRRSALSTENAPSPRVFHTATWTGSPLVILGGGGGDTRGNARLEDLGAGDNPILDAWLPLLEPHAPAPRLGHTALWTGSGIILWGGGGIEHALSDGAILVL